MTRSDILLNNIRMANGEMTEDEKLDFVNALHKKIEGIYSILFVMENTHLFDTLSKMIRDTLEK